MKEYILLENDNVVKHICASNNFKSSVYKVIEAENWVEEKEFDPESEPTAEERKNISQEEKAEEFPEEKSYIERVKSGEIPIPMGTKIENDEILPMSKEEILESNLPNEFKIQTLIDYLFSTDWVVIKTLELQLSGKKATHDYSDILSEREKARAKINELEAITVVDGAHKNLV